MTTIPLNRRFYEWSDDGGFDRSRYRVAVGLSDGMLGWEALLAKRRVVILAEAGSGKTEELTEQARLQTAAGKFAFYATVQDVGRDGLDRGLRPADRLRLNAWRASNEPGWFFVDSIDEAKLNHIRLDRALRQLADGIIGAEGRAHVVLSGRHTDWEFSRDARRLNEELPILKVSPVEPLPSLETLVRRVLRHEARPEPAAVETPLVVVMAPLNVEQVRAYASAKNVPNLDGLIAAIEAANIEKLARRPLDLDWIVRYWRTNGGLGSFTAMIETSLRERLLETDPDRSRRDSLDSERAKQGLERIGAAMVLGRHSTVAIPDAEVRIEDDRAVASIDGVLPDWSSADRQQLLARPAFDPATFGRAKLHNDNEGVVRAYLAARWLQRLRQANLPRRQLHDLLFSRTYEIELVKPSMMETAAWLSLWDERIATEVVRRAPFLLFTAGDPAGLSPATRRALLTALVEWMRRNEDVPLLDLGSVARFAQPDIAPVLRISWETDKEHTEIRRFLLRLIWLGSIKGCADLAAAASFGNYSDLSTAIVAGRALLAAGDEGVQRDYADYIKRECASIPTTVVWEAVETLFPRLIGIDDLLAILAVVRLGDDDGGGFDLEWNGAKLIEPLTSAAELTRLIEGLLAQLEAQPQGPDAEVPSSRDEQYSTVLAAAAKRLLELSAPTAAPVAAIDAVLRIGDRRFDGTPHWSKCRAAAVELLQRTPERRRGTFWRAADRLSGHRVLTGRPLLYLFQMQPLGWPSGLVPRDIDWLLADAPTRERDHERRLAINAALGVWSTADQPESVKTRIAAVAATDVEMQATYDEWMTPRVKSDDEIRSEEDLAEVRRKNDGARSEQEKSWVDFIADMRANPEQLRHPQPTTATTVDGRLYNLWQLLNQATQSNSRYAIDSVAPIAEIAGQEVAAALAEGLAKVWREWKPTLRSARAPNERNQIEMIDCMGIAGVSIEAASRADWALRLTEEQATRAAEYATLEINGLPDWTAALVAAWPAALAKVLAREIASELDNPSPDTHYQTLEYISRGDEGLSRLMAPALWNEMRDRGDLTQRALRPMLPVLRLGLSESNQKEFSDIALERFRTADDPQVSAQYLGAAYAINAGGAIEALVAKLDLNSEAAKTALVERVLPQIFGSRRGRFNLARGALDPATLERLVLIAYRTVRVEDDHDRANKGVYSPDERDEAQEARSAAFSTLVSTPGRAAFNAILRLLDVPDFPLPASRLRALARERAAQDAEHMAWAADETFRFEQQFEKQPVTGQELRLVALQRLEDLQHDLINGDFQQGNTLRALPDERAVQNWMADRLRQVQANAYSVEREVHVADEKEPDLRFRAKASDANVATEIKIAESWTLKQLEDALVKQLCGQYLRSGDGREGILLLVHKKPRPNGWKQPDGSYLNFDALVRHLGGLAAGIRRESPSGPQPQVFAMDVSICI
jgi:hypothetical protein